jgi:hypothetical protein
MRYLMIISRNSAEENDEGRVRKPSVLAEIRTEYLANSSLHTVTPIPTAWSYTSTPPICLYGLVRGRL